MGRVAQATEETVTAMLKALLLLPCEKEEDRVAFKVGYHPNTLGSHRAPLQTHKRCFNPGREIWGIIRFCQLLLTNKSSLDL